MFATGTLTHTFTGKEKLQSKSALTAFDFIFPADGKGCCVLIADKGIAFNAGNVGDTLIELALNLGQVAVIVKVNSEALVMQVQTE